MWEDPIVQEVRREREKLSEQFNFDVDAIFEDLRKRQSTLGERLIRPKRRESPENKSARVRNSDSAALHPGR
jgi:hypothetical protein